MSGQITVALEVEGHFEYLMSEAPWEIPTDGTLLTGRATLLLSHFLIQREPKSLAHPLSLTVLWPPGMCCILAFSFNLLSCVSCLPI